jgi:hypothetical protein
MSDIANLNIRFKIHPDGDAIDLKNISVCPEKITITGTAHGLRIDVKNYGGSDLAWFALADDKFRLEITQ